jgi:hypothetical protein
LSPPAQVQNDISFTGTQPPTAAPSLRRNRTAARVKAARRRGKSGDITSTSSGTPQWQMSQIISTPWSRAARTIGKTLDQSKRPSLGSIRCQRSASRTVRRPMPAIRP